MKQEHIDDSFTISLEDLTLITISLMNSADNQRNINILVTNPFDEDYYYEKNIDFKISSAVNTHKFETDKLTEILLGMCFQNNLENFYFYLSEDPKTKIRFKKGTIEYGAIIQIFLEICNKIVTLQILLQKKSSEKQLSRNYYEKKMVQLEQKLKQKDTFIRQIQIANQKLKSQVSSYVSTLHEMKMSFGSQQKQIQELKEYIKVLEQKLLNLQNKQIGCENAKEPQIQQKTANIGQKNPEQKLPFQPLPRPNQNLSLNNLQKNNQEQNLLQQQSSDRTITIPQVSREQNQKKGPFDQNSQQIIQQQLRNDSEVFAKDLKNVQMIPNRKQVQDKMKITEKYILTELQQLGKKVALQMSKLNGQQNQSTPQKDKNSKEKAEEFLDDLFQGKCKSSKIKGASLDNWIIRPKIEQSAQKIFKEMVKVEQSEKILFQEKEAKIQIGNQKVIRENNVRNEQSDEDFEEYIEEQKPVLRNRTGKININYEEPNQQPQIQETITNKSKKSKPIKKASKIKTKNQRQLKPKRTNNKPLNLSKQSNVSNKKPKKQTKKQAPKKKEQKNDRKVLSKKQKTKNKARRNKKIITQSFKQNKEQEDEIDTKQLLQFCHEHKVRKLQELIQQNRLLSSKTILLTFHKLTIIPPFCPLPALQKLNLSYNQILQISNLTCLENLIELNLQKNRISQIKNLDHLVKLEKLNLALNQINEIKGLRKNISLKIINFKANKITNLAYTELYELKFLNSLNLNQNKGILLKNDTKNVINQLKKQRNGELEIIL